MWWWSVAATALLALWPHACGAADNAASTVVASEGVTLACGATPSGRPRSRFAYARMHYEGTERDKEYVLGTRVLIQSLLASGTTQDIVVLASKTVSRASINRFCDDGAVVEVRVCVRVCVARRHTRPPSHSVCWGPLLRPPF